MTHHHTIRLALLGVLLSPAAHAVPSCEPITTPDDIQDALDRAETALTDLDIEGFQRNVRDAEALLPCVGTRLSSPVIADFHRFWALRAFGVRDPLARQAFAAARSLEPGYRFPETLIPSGNPVLQEYIAVDPGASSTERVDAPADGVLLFDGRSTLERPIDRPVVVQLATDLGVNFTAYVLPDMPLPTYVALREAPPGTPPSVARGSPRIPLLVGTSAAAVLTGTLYGVALAGQARYKDLDRDPVPDVALPGLRARTNALVVASAATATATVGAGVALALAW